MAQVSAVNGPITVDDDDTFERDLKEMLKDGPSLNDLSSTVQGGNAVGPGAAQPPPSSAQPRAGPAAVPTSLPCTGGGMTRQQTPPGRNFATSMIPLSSPEHNGAEHIPRLASPGSNASSKLDTIKAWTINTYKCTRQIVQEKLGRSSRTVDVELEAQIESLRDTQRKYANILRLARALSSHFYHVVQTQRQLGDAFSELSQKNPELQNEFQYNSETQKVLCKNGETLLGALNFFTSSVNTLCHKTMEDTLQTVKAFEAARVEFDAYRTERDGLQGLPRDATSMARLTDAESRFAQHKEKYDKLRADVAIKLKFLDENKVKVMHKQLLLFHNAVAAYFSGNQAALEATLKQFNIKLKPPNADKPSWLEQ